MKTLTAQEIFEKLKGKFGDAVVEFQAEGFNPPFVVVAPGPIQEICRFLKEDPELLFGSVMCISGVDYKTGLRNASNLPAGYRRQRSIYSEALSRLFPDRETAFEFWWLGG
jgi:NADH:ubiquinone oxidoreductase subunit C